jgi:prophage regulatory protein
MYLAPTWKVHRRATNSRWRSAISLNQLTSAKILPFLLGHRRYVVEYKSHGSPQKVWVFMAVQILRRPMVQSRTGLSRSAIYLKIAQGTFPKPISLGARAVGWLDAEVEEWLSDRIKLSRASAIQPQGQGPLQNRGSDVGITEAAVLDESVAMPAVLTSPPLRQPIRSFAAAPASSKQKNRRPW